MKIVLEINNQVGCNFDEKKLKLAVAETIKNSGLKNVFSKKVTISLGFVSSKEIQKINQKYRGKNSSTDILSFANYETQEIILKKKGNDIFLGEMIVCCKNIENYIQKKNISLDEEMIRVVSHGILHLLGFSHSRKMFEIQEAVIKKFNIFYK